MDESQPESAFSAPSRARAEFDLAALCRNLGEIERRSGPGLDIIASVKADAYGHGAVAVARALEAASVFALATGSVNEAVQIREAHVATPILLFPGFLPDAIPSVLQHRLMPGIDSLELARELSARAASPVPVWLKVDAGLGRHGVLPEDAVAFAEALRGLPLVELDGVFTHLPFVDRAGREWAETRLASFTSVLRSLEARGLEPPHSQALSSAGALAGLADSSSAICPGHAMYGIPPAAAEEVSMRGLEPVARSISSVLSRVAPNPTARSVGVGGAREFAAGAVTGVVSIGRRDGYRWHADQAATMLVRGERAPVVGLSLEHVMLDLTQVPGAQPGDDVVVFGEQGDASITLAELGAWRRSTPVETLLDFAGQVARDYVGLNAENS